MNYMDQTIRAIRETIMEMVRLQEYPDYPSRLSCLYAAKAMKMLLNGKHYLILQSRSFADC